ncbi:MAG: helix-turn-helix transcriptional regulator [Candidatus Eremiobacteraeota bacterium]|nr:helix-turn-helix transcriptional regulator [Candidatus Eremiobacteraeota bacterium]
MIFDEEKIDGLIKQCRITEAIAAQASVGSERRQRAGIFALAGDDRGVARAIDPELFACRSAADVAAYYLAMGIEPTVQDRLTAAAVLAWSADSEGVYAALDAAHDRAVSEKQFHFAIATRERLAAHALLFGEIARARAAIAEAIVSAEARELSGWRLRCIAAAARLALEAGDLDVSAQLLARGRAVARSSDELALFAGVGAQLAVEREDRDALERWTSESIVESALRSEEPDVAIAATIATVIGVETPSSNSTAARALRRALALTESPAKVPELFSIAARYGDLDEARFAVAALAALWAPNRAYLNAHRLIAQAHLSLRNGERGESVDSAGDAARAFSAMGSRRWTNEAMRLLVSQEPAERRMRPRSSAAALTEREEQVAHLIRRGARNREVAIALQISEHTVERHVSSILGRLGLRSRWQISDPGRASES